VVADAPALAPALAGILRARGWTEPSMIAPRDSYALLQAAVTAQGMHALVGPAPPLQDLLVWRSQAVQQFTVELTDQQRQVTVVFLSDFLSRGWKHYAALGLAATTGWVEDGSLYCVEDAYAPGTESFEVSYLKHEGRHLADLERFPGLSAVELEYRAKLTELAFASKTLRGLLDDFSEKSAPNPGSPHAAANFRVTQDAWRELYGSSFPGGNQVWMTVSPWKVNRAARRLLERSTEGLVGGIVRMPVPGDCPKPSLVSALRALSRCERDQICF
jgi:hypothetical protein